MKINKKQLVENDKYYKGKNMNKKGKFLAGLMLLAILGVFITTCEGPMGQPGEPGTIGKANVSVEKYAGRGAESGGKE